MSQGRRHAETGTLASCSRAVKEHLQDETAEREVVDAKGEVMRRWHNLPDQLRRVDAATRSLNTVPNSLVAVLAQGLLRCRARQQSTRSVYF